MAAGATCAGGLIGGHMVGGPLGEDQLHHRLAPSGGGSSSGFVIRVAAAANQRGVADASRRFVQRATGGGGRRDVAMAVKGNGADGVMRVEISALNSAGTAEVALLGGVLPALDLTRQNQFAVVDEAGCRARWRNARRPRRQSRCEDFFPARRGRHARDSAGVRRSRRPRP